MKKIVLGMVLAVAAVCAADLKIATVNMVDLVRLHPDHEKNRALVKSTDKDYKERLSKYQDDLKQISEDLRKAFEDSQNPMLSAGAKAASQKKIEDLQKKGMAAQQELRTAANRFQGDLTDLETRLLKLETEDIRAKINAFAKSAGYDLVADSTMLAFASEKLDVTDEILKAMKVDPAKRKEGKDAK
ncbi:MAG: OmpH family outer membrane protein [Kiritimatiellia bacterium]